MFDIAFSEIMVIAVVALIVIGPEKLPKTARTLGHLYGRLRRYVTDVKADFFDGKMHPVDSKDIAFQVAGYHAFKEAFQAAAPCLLEPIYKVDVMVPEDFVGAIMGDLSSRRGHIQGVDSDGHFQIVRAQIPQKELYHYSTIVRSLTSGRGRHSESFSHYAEVPAEFAAKLLAEAKARREAEHNGKAAH